MTAISDIRSAFARHAQQQARIPYGKIGIAVQVHNGRATKVKLVGRPSRATSNGHGRHGAQADCVNKPSLLFLEGRR